MISGAVPTSPTSFVLEYFFFALQNLGAGGVKEEISFLGVSDNSNKKSVKCNSLA